MNVLLAFTSAQHQSLHINLRPARPSGTYNDGTQDWHLYLCTEILAADRVIGAWNPDGSVATDDQDPPQPIPIHSDYLDFIRPMGNDTGTATDSLDYHGWAGGGQRHVQSEPAADTLPQYPADRQPHVVRVDRTYVTDDAHSHIPHRYKFTFIFADPSRSPGVRTFGFYSDPECTQYLGTVGGAFVEEDDGEGGSVWVANAPGLHWTAEPQVYHFAMLEGPTQEGHFTLEIGTQSMTRNFFALDQGEEPGGGVIEWAPGQSVVIGDLRTYNGPTYECRQSHTTQVGWEPPNVLALWLPV